MSGHTSVEREDGGPAFPVETIRNSSGALGNQTPYGWNFPGLTKREWFAGMALLGYLSNPKTTEHPAFDRESLASECFRIADEMIAKSEGREVAK